MNAKFELWWTSNRPPGGIILKEEAKFAWDHQQETIDLLTRRLKLVADHLNDYATSLKDLNQ